MTRLAGLFAALLLAAGLTGCTGSDDVSANCGFHFRYATDLGRTIPPSQRKPCSFTAELINGGKYALDQHRGRVVVLSFWAQWCSPCAVEIPQLDLLARADRGKGVEFVGVDIKDVRGKARAFLHEHDVSLPIIFDEPGEVALRMGNLPAEAIPFSVLVDKRGRIAAVYTARLSPKDIEPVLDKLLAEP